jgi:streptogramin lyase
MHQSNKSGAETRRQRDFWNRFFASFALLGIICAGSSPAWSGKAGGMWIAGEGSSTVDEVLPNQRKHSGVVSPTILNGSSVDAPCGVCFDKSKNLWVTGFGDTVLEFTPAQLKKLRTTSDPTPNVTITSSSFLDTIGCTFDKNGNLWIVDDVIEGVLQISKAQLNAGSGDITPAITITSTATFVTPNFPIFDKSGNLWITEESAAEVVQFTPNQLTSSGDQAPAVVLSDDGNGSLDEPGQPGFDGKGNLWVPNFTNSTVVMFKKSDLGASGSPTPAVTLNSASVMSSQSLDGPWGLAFQGKGTLWVANYTSGNISKFIPSQLKMSGSPVPKVFLKGIESQMYQITFGPVF